MRHIEVLPNDAMSPLFLAVTEATEEAVYNSLLRATTITGRGHTIEGLPLEKTVAILKKYGAPLSEGEASWSGKRENVIYAVSAGLAGHMVIVASRAA